jgi:hypothetical protein
MPYLYQVKATTSIAGVVVLLAQLKGYKVTGKKSITL